MNRRFAPVIGRAAVLALLGVTLAACGGGNKCTKACDKVKKCWTGGGDAGATSPNPGWTCPLSAGCNEKETCQAECYIAADCEAIKGNNAGSLNACLSQCNTIVTKDGGTQPDKGQNADKGPLPDKGPCTPNCAGRKCGPDGCGGQCGTCPSPQVCNTYGQCINNCTPQCSGKQCGPDGCGGSCGTCGPPTTCNASGQCYCQPQCSGKQCGPDGCGGQCGTCTQPLVCDSSGTCKSTCSPNCAGKQCGDDGCGGSCGTCPSTQTCSNGVCGNKTIGTGQICTNKSLCSQPADTCMFFSSTATNGMCLTTCTNIGDPCNAPNPSTQFAACAIPDSSGNNYCGFFCEISGSKFACPNATDFDCLALDPTVPSVKLCVPK